MAIINSEEFDNYGLFALEYRLGLDDFAKLLKVSREDVIETVESFKNNDMDKYRWYSFLFYGDEKVSNAYRKADYAIKRCAKISEDDTLTKDEKNEKMKSYLCATDRDFESVPIFGDGDRTHEDYIKISKYRLKYALSANQIAQDENERKRISDHETRYDPEMRERLKNLETYLLSNRATARYLDKKHNAYDIEDYSSNIKYVEKFNDSISEEEYGQQK